MRIIKTIFITLILLIVLTAIGTGIYYSSKNVETKSIKAADRKAAGGDYIKLTAGVTHYQAAGPDTGKVVILIHGFSVPYFMWDGTFEYLASKGFKVIRYDMYGRGFSDRPDTIYNKSLYMRQLLDLIQKLHLKTPLSLAGISFGGAVTTDFACIHPDLINRVILIDPAYKLTPPKVPQFLTLFNEATGADDRANGQLTDFKYPAQHPDWVGKYKVQMQYKGFRNAIVSTQYNYPYNGLESSSCLDKAKKPVLLIWGREDKTVPFIDSDSIRNVLKVDFFPVEDAAHLPSVEKSLLVNAKIAGFLRSPLPNPPR